MDCLTVLFRLCFPRCLSACVSTAVLLFATPRAALGHYIHAARIIRLIPIWWLIIIPRLTNNDTPLNDQRFHGSRARLSATHYRVTHTLLSTALGIRSARVSPVSRASRASRAAILVFVMSTGLRNHRDFPLKRFWDRCLARCGSGISVRSEETGL